MQVRRNESLMFLEPSEGYILVAVFYESWAMGEEHCKASTFVMGLSVIGSVFNITAIAINSYCYICHSMAYHCIYQRWYTPLHICLIWLLSVVALLPSFFVGSLEYDLRIYSCTFIQTASTSCLNAIVYGLLNQNFRSEYKRILLGLWNPWHFIQDASKGSHAEGRHSPAPPITGVQHPAQPDAL
ncbi:Melatonin receptor type 1B [Plecturocebus cupreus]